MFLSGQIVHSPWPSRFVLELPRNSAAVQFLCSRSCTCVDVIFVFWTVVNLRFCYKANEQRHCGLSLSAAQSLGNRRLTLRHGKDFWYNCRSEPVQPRYAGGAVNQVPYQRRARKRRWLMFVLFVLWNSSDSHRIDLNKHCCLGLFMFQSCLKSDKKILYSKTYSRSWILSFTRDNTVDLNSVGRVR